MFLLLVIAAVKESYNGRKHVRVGITYLLFDPEENSD